MFMFGRMRGARAPAAEPLGCLRAQSLARGWLRLVSASSPSRHAADVLVLPQNDALGEHFLQPGCLHQHNHCFLLPLCRSHFHG